MFQGPAGGAEGFFQILQAPLGGAQKLMEILQAFWGGFLQSLFVGLMDVADGCFRAHRVGLKD